ncbi:MAG: hypothetical protein ACYDHH_34740 [Solirubrobacteraceae bacterium]
MAILHLLAARTIADGNSPELAHDHRDRPASEEPTVRFEPWASTPILITERLFHAGYTVL